MISDVLSDALADIRDYQRNMPDVYAAYRDDIEEAKAAMLRLRMRLDTPPPAKGPEDRPGSPVALLPMTGWDEAEEIRLADGRAAAVGWWAADVS